MTFHHIGIACFDIEESSQFYILQGYTKTDTVYDPIQNVNIYFLHNLECGRGGARIELVSPKDSTSPVNKILQKNGVSPYHICYETESLEESISKLRAQKLIMAPKPSPAVAFSGKRVCFMFSKHIGLIELVERMPSEK